ncbi:M15 family metallopeptidase [Pseudogemmobacter humi]|uniref:Peptidase M15C domain-containing protein n=1 Tax=Pseudogemmobacter humi TaxID=2483812 RepID=A0A3P5XR01_9RHOB|nr:M15 family metallopeptidase [Pseudogemmobacter humi]VDC33320.1 hypothetical protein XINFAN_03768 [Pseudogemmobacter humi]
MKPVQIVIAAIVVIAVALIGFGLWTLWPERERQQGGSAVDSLARIEIENLQQQIAGLQEQLDAMQLEIDGLGMMDAIASYESPGSADETPAPFPRDGENTILGDYASVVLIAGRRDVNRGLTVASPSFLEGFLGRPRQVLSDDCEPMDNPKLKEMLIVEQVGPIKVQMLRPALDSLKEVFGKVREADQDLYDRISTAGSLCVRRIRGTTDRTSTHSFGLAVDLNIDGHLDGFADGKTQLGLTILADFFHAEGWVWGAGFSREDSMHFEVSRQQLERWRAEGKI